MRLKIILFGVMPLAAAVAAFPNYRLSESAAQEAKRASGREEAVEMAKKPVLTVYKSLEPYEFTVQETKKRRIVIFELKDKSLDGRAPFVEIVKAVNYQ